jgi:hypothetical protein
MCLQAAWRTTHSRASGCRRVEDSDFGRNDSLEMPGGLRPPLQALCIRQKNHSGGGPLETSGAIGRGFGLSELEIESAGAPLACYYSIGSDEVDLQAGFPVDRAIATRGQIKMVQMEGNPAVTATLSSA